MPIRAVWSGYSLFVDIYYSIHWLCKRTTQALISLRNCAGWSGPALSAYCIRALFVRCASYTNFAGWSGPALSAYCIRALFVRRASYTTTNRRVLPNFPEIIGYLHSLPYLFWNLEQVIFTTYSSVYKLLDEWQTVKTQISYRWFCGGWPGSTLFTQASL